MPFDAFYQFIKGEHLYEVFTVNGTYFNSVNIFYKRSK